MQILPFVEQRSSIGHQSPSRYTNRVIPFETRLFFRVLHWQVMPEPLGYLWLKKPFLSPEMLVICWFDHCCMGRNLRVTVVSFNGFVRNILDFEKLAFLSIAKSFF